ncbi:hypothetical protein [Aquimarina agarilytica]|nr:hypothetical protein [Aquimarina agarilytica]
MELYPTPNFNATNKNSVVTRRSLDNILKSVEVRKKLITKLEQSMVKVV